MNTFNTPRMQGQGQQNQIRRWVHQPLTIEHYGIHAKIQPNGKVKIQKVADEQSEEAKKSGEVEFDEVELPASFIFKLAFALKTTRRAEYINIGESKDSPEGETEEV